MKQYLNHNQHEEKKRVTAFIDPVIVKRARARGVLEGLTISEMVEKALDEYAPKIESDKNHNVSLKFLNGPEIQKIIPGGKTNEKTLNPKPEKDRPAIP